MTGTLSRVAIHAVPRSGTTWFGELFNSSPHTIYKFQPLFSYALKDFLSTSSSKSEIDAFFSKLESTNDDFLDQTENRKAGILTKFQKSKITHLVYKEVRYHHIIPNLIEKDSSIFVLALIRDPRAVIHSWLKAPREFRIDLGWKDADEWRFARLKNKDREEEFFGFHRWLKATSIFEDLAKRFPSRFRIVQYEHLVEHTSATLKSIFTWCGLPWAQQTEDFILESTSITHPSEYSIFRQSSLRTNWQDELDMDIAMEIEREVHALGFSKYLSNLESSA